MVCPCHSVQLSSPALLRGAALPATPRAARRPAQALAHHHACADALARRGQVLPPPSLAELNAFQAAALEFIGLSQIIHP